MENAIKITELPAGVPTSTYTVDNFVIEGVNGPTRKLSGKYFVFDVSWFQYFHVLNDKIGQFEVLRKIHDNLKLLCVANTRWEFEGSNRIDISLNILDMISVYGLTIDDIYFIDEGPIQVEQCVYYVKTNNKFLPDETPYGNELYHPQNFEDPVYINALCLVKSRYKEKLYPDFTLPKKIFITRKKLNDTVRYIYYLLTNQDKLTTEERLELERKIKGYGGEKYLWQLVDQRYITEQDENKLETYFMHQGYVIIDPAAMTFFEQINHYHNATHIVSVRGSGLVNTIFCQDFTKVFILDLSQSYDFPYKEIPNISTDYVYEIPAKRKNIRHLSKEFFSVDNVIAIIDNHYGELI